MATTKKNEKTLDQKLHSAAKNAMADMAVEKADGYADAYNFLGCVVQVLVIAAKNGSALEKKYARQFLDDAMVRKEIAQDRAAVRQKLLGVL